MAIKVFFNNSCSVCRLEINHYKKIADSNLEWIDITNNETTSGKTVFTRLGQIKVATGATFHVSAGTTFIMDVLGVF